MLPIARSRTALLALTGVSFVGILAGCSSTSGSASDSAGSGGTKSSGSSSSSGYKDGTYTEQGTYSSPGGKEVISVELTIAKDAVSDVTVKTVTADPTATQYEAKFISGIHAAVVGKKIDDLNVTKVAGSSLTSQGFDDALSKIKTDAAA